MDKISRTKTGLVVSDKMDKTVIVLISRLKKHPLYKKQYTVTKKYKAHDQNNEYKVGDSVLISETKPISRDKKYKVVSKVS